MCYRKFFEIVFSLQLASGRVTNIGLVLVLFLFLFLDKVRDRDTTILLQHTLAFIHIRAETIQTVHLNMSVVLPFYYLLFFSF